MDGTATISLDTLDELREKAEEARLATNRSKKFTSKLMDCYEFDTEKYNKALKEIDNKEGLTDKQCSKLIREAMVKHLKIVVDPEMLKELIREYIDEEISDEHLDIARATMKELKQIQVVLKEKVRWRKKMEKTCKTCMENDCGLCDRTGRLVEDDDQCEKWTGKQTDWRTRMMQTFLAGH